MERKQGQESMFGVINTVSSKSCTVDGSVQYTSVVQSCLTLQIHELQHARLPCLSPSSPELTQTHVHWVGDAIQPSYPLSSPPLPAFNLSQHQGLFKWVSSSHQVAKVLGVSASALVLPMNIQDWVPLGLTGLISFQSKGLLKESSPTPQFKSTISLALSFLYSPTLTSIHDYTVKTIALTRWTFGDKVISLLFNMLYRLVIAFLLRSKCLDFMDSPPLPKKISVYSLERLS